MLSTIQSKAHKVLHVLEHQVERVRNSGNLPELSLTDRLIVDALRSEGAFVTSLDALSIPSTPNLLNATERLIPNMPPATPADLVARPGYTKIAAEYPEIFLWGLEDRLLNIVEHYIGLPPACIGADLRKEIANENRHKGSRLWHKDSEDYRQVKIIVYLNDVSEDVFAFEYIPKRLTPNNPFKSVYTDEEMAKTVPPSEWKLCLGPSGTVVFADPSQIYHHGKTPGSRGKDRFALFYSYTSRQPRRLEFCKTQFSKEGLLILENRLSQRQRDTALWYL